MEFRNRPEGRKQRLQGRGLTIWTTICGLGSYLGHSQLHNVTPRWYNGFWDSFFRFFPSVRSADLDSYDQPLESDENGENKAMCGKWGYYGPERACEVRGEGNYRNKKESRDKQRAKKRERRRKLNTEREGKKKRERVRKERRRTRERVERARRQGSRPQDKNVSQHKKEQLQKRNTK